MLSKNDLFSIQSGWSSKLMMKYKSQFIQFFSNLKNHFSNNKNANKILQNYIKNKTISESDAVILKTIIKDNLKLVGLGSLAIIPIPGTTLLMLFLINSAKKLNIDLLPSEFKNNKTNENINTYPYTISHENWGDSYKIIIRNESSPNQKLIGVMDYQHNDNEYYIESIAVQPFYKRMGYAKLMFEELLKLAKQNNIETIRLHAYSMDNRISTEKLVEMYQKWGFVVTDNESEKVEMIYKL